MANVHFDDSFTTEEFHERVRAEYTARAPRYNGTSGGTPLSLRTEIIQHLLSLYPPRSPVLDVACGTGILCGLVHDAGGDVTGLDITPAMLSVARRDYPTFKFVEGKAEKLPFPDDSFASVYISFALVYFTDIPGALREIRRVLQPGGFLAFQTTSGDSYIIGVATEKACLRALGEEKGRKTFRVPGTVTDSPVELRNLMDIAGFEDVEISSMETYSKLDVDVVMGTWDGGFFNNAFLSRINDLSAEEKVEVRMKFLEYIEEYRGDDGVLRDKVLYWFVKGFKP